MATGGTPAPPVIPGAPTVIGQRGQPASTPGRPAQGRGGGGEKRYWNNASKRMETAAQIRNYKAPAPSRPGAVSKTLGAPTQKPVPGAKAASYPYAAGVLNPGGVFSEAERNEIGKNITGAENAERAATRIPFQQRGSEIVNTEGNVRNSLNQINTGSQTYLQGLIAGAEGSAKTANNYAAENALSAQKQVETAGQNAQTNIGGIMAGNVAATQQRGEADVQSMRTLAAAAAAQGAQGLNTAQARFATEASRNKAAEAQALEKVAGKARNERMEIPIKLEAGKFAQEKLKQQGELGAAKLNQNQQAINVKKGQLGVNQFTATTKARQGQEKLNLSAQELNRRWTETNNKAAQNAAHDQYLNASLGEKTAVDNANIKFKEGELRSKWEANWIKQHAGQKAPKQTAASINKVIGEFGRTLGEIESAAILGGKKGFNRTELREALAKGYGAIKIGGKEKAVKTGSVTNRLIIKAAEEVWDKHYVGPQTKAALGALGLPTEGWSEQLKRG